MSNQSPEENEEERKDPLAAFFDVPVSDTSQSTALAPVPGTTMESELDQDFRVARENMQQVVELSRVAAEDAARLAKQMEQPRAYDALSKMLATALMANKAILEIHKHKQDVDQPPSAPGGDQYHTHTTVYMTTADMQRRIDEARRANEEANEEADEANEEES